MVVVTGLLLLGSLVAWSPVVLWRFGRAKALSHLK